ncbi:putative T6SS immunity periplasmic lipoprotein [Gilliamella sp. ESL0254]|uniref:putative T6SS immunity periplasmic lipoprotein n=1 Tax=Gilliamella sp. ESL0254 TaxID=2705035 RepID=UPI001580F424|nr:hypothetical protein [Gilliamella sp. ESL0254]NUF27781.1 hypothetical protein [Gilliamella sp. ESL0254]
MKKNFAIILLIIIPLISLTGCYPHYKTEVVTVTPDITLNNDNQLCISIPTNQIMANQSIPIDTIYITETTLSEKGFLEDWEKDNWKGDNIRSGECLKIEYPLQANTTYRIKFTSKLTSDPTFYTYFRWVRKFRLEKQNDGKFILLLDNKANK